MRDKNRLAFDIKPKPLEKIPYKKQIKTVLKEVDMKGKEVPEPKYSLSDYLNIIIGLIRGKSLEALGFEKPANHTLQLILVAVIVIGLIILSIIAK